MGEPRILVVMEGHDIHPSAPVEADRLNSVIAIGPPAFLPFLRIGDDLLCNFPRRDPDVMRFELLQSLGVNLRGFLDGLLDEQDCGERQEP